MRAVILMIEWECRKVADVPCPAQGPLLQQIVSAGILQTESTSTVTLGERVCNMTVVRDWKCIGDGQLGGTVCTYGSTVSVKDQELISQR